MFLTYLREDYENWNSMYATIQIIHFITFVPLLSLAAILDYHGNDS